MVSYSSSGGGGKTYKISTKSGASIERITRLGAAEDVLQRFVERAEKRRPPVDDSGVADLRWGEPSRFSLVQAEAPTNPSFTINNNGGPDEEDPVPPEAEVRVYTEIQKELEEVRVENPDDAEQYIITKRRLWSLMRAPDGTYAQFVWDNSDIDS
jgi:hypothetical protein